ncbi:MAG: ABC transporter ATP-binding protein [Gordonia sp. (in: high G+C Gram-positive bacteria)]
MIAAVEQVTVRFGDRIALDQVSLGVGAGELVAVVGGDGAGKTTLLRVLAGELGVDAGATRPVPRIRLGFLSAGPGSWAALTVRQNLDFVGGCYRLHGAALARRRDAIIDRCGLAAAVDRPAAALSGGMRRKLGVAMALLHRPALVILDEPSTGVDPVSRLDLWRLVSEAAADGAAVVVSTTYLDEAQRATRLLVLDDGHELVSGTYPEIHAAFPGVITAADRPERPEWSWRRGRARHEYWPAPSGSTMPGTPVDPDLEDIVVALSLRRRGTVREGDPR